MEERCVFCPSLAVSALTSVYLQVFLDYADCIQGLQAESPQLNHFEPVLLRLIKAVPRLVDQGGAGMKLQVCIEEMQSRLIAISSMLYQVG